MTCKHLQVRSIKIWQNMFLSIFMSMSFLPLQELEKTKQVQEGLTCSNELKKLFFMHGFHPVVWVDTVWYRNKFQF